MACGPKGHAISIHALLAESDQAQSLKIPAHRISIHALLAESDANNQTKQQEQRISIHALLAESDWVLMGGLNCDAYFYPRSPCGERRAKLYYFACPFCISIHALLAESD